MIRKFRHRNLRPECYDLQHWLSEVPLLGLAAEHGARWRMPGSDAWEGRPAEIEWKGPVRPILQHFVDRTPGSFIEEKEFALVWHFRTIEAEFGDWLATELVAMLEGMLAESELRAYRGNKIVEVKPIWANKGALATELLPRFVDAAFVMGIGDDRTDEDLFTHLPETAWSVRVGVGPSKARYSVTDISALRRLLRDSRRAISRLGSKEPWTVFVPLTVDCRISQSQSILTGTVGRGLATSDQTHVVFGEWFPASLKSKKRRWLPVR